MALDRPGLREQIRDAIIERILSGEYPPGSRVVETRVAEELGVSQASVREALRELEAMRFIETERYRGARVRAVTEEELAEIYPIRAALEQLAGTAAAPRATPALLADLQEQIDAMHHAAAAGDHLAQLAHDARFHELVVEASGNRTLHEVWRSLRIEARTLVTVLTSDTDLVEIADSHAPILEALRAGDGRAAGTRMREHILRHGAAMRQPPRARRARRSPTAGVGRGTR